jgi:hypothetical protein
VGSDQDERLTAKSSVWADESGVGRVVGDFKRRVASIPYDLSRSDSTATDTRYRDAVHGVATDRSRPFEIAPALLIVAPAPEAPQAIIVGPPPVDARFASVAISVVARGDWTTGDRPDINGATTAEIGSEKEEPAGQVSVLAGQDRPGAWRAPRDPGWAKPAGWMLAIWAALVIVLNAALWLSGVRPLALQQAVEQGAARAELRSVGETTDGQGRKAVRTQRATLEFWTTLALIDEFVVEPSSLAVRALAVATLLSALAALAGRQMGFRAALDGCATIQGLWVAGLAVQTNLMIALRRPDVETSLALLLPAGTYSAPLWVALRQVDAFALLGWAALIRGGWSRGQTNLATSAAACGSVALCELCCRVVFALTTGGAMRLMLMPDGP